MLDSVGAQSMILEIIISVIHSYTSLPFEAWQRWPLEPHWSQTREGSLARWETEEREKGRRLGPQRVSLRPRRRGEEGA